MNKLSCISSFLFASALFLPGPHGDGYIIEIPETIDLTETRSFDIKIIQNNLEDNQIVHVRLPDSFTLSDSCGRCDIEGKVGTNEIDFTGDASESVTVELELEELPAGRWNGTLPIRISLETKTPSNVLECGKELNVLLKTVDPQRLVFTSQIPQAECIGDVSLAKDGSICLYENDRTVYIANGSDQKILSGEDLSEAFKDLTSLSYIDLDHLDTYGCRDMSHMFENDRSLVTISGIEALETENARFMNSLFSGCRELNALRIDGWNTGNTVDMSDMFRYCTKLRSLYLNAWNVSACEDFSNMFAQCTSLYSVGDLSCWNMSNARSISGLFDSCGNLKSIGDLGGWNTENTADLSKVFRNCGRLENIGDLSLWDVHNARDLSELFANAVSLSSCGTFSSWNVSSQCLNLSGIFRNTGSLLPPDLKLDAWDVSSVIDMSHMFENALLLQNLYISGWNTESLENAQGMFAFDQTGRLSQLTRIIGIENIETAALKNISKIFYGNQNLNADLSAWNTSSLQDISYAFYGNYRFDVDKLKHWNVSSVSDMTEAFGDNAGAYLHSPIPAWYH